ncbi:hypothetical protein D1872_155340 [compost metagenome]
MGLTFATLIAVLALLFLLVSIISKISKVKAILYRNEQYGFTLRLPLNWRGKYIIKENIWKKDGYRSVDFAATYENGKRLYPVLSIIICDDKDKIVENKFVNYLREKDGLHYAYACDLGDPHDYLSDNPRMLKKISDMTVNDAPEIAQTIKFIG